MMEPENCQAQVRTSQAASYANQSVLILDQSSTPCIADKCDALPGLLQASLSVRRRQERRDTRLPHSVSSVRDLVLVRPPAGERALIASCKERWAPASILALLCVKRDRLC